MPGSRAPAAMGIALVTVLCSTTRSSISAAQTRPSLDTRTWTPSVDPEASLVLEPPSTPGPGRWSLGAWARFDGAPVVLASQPSGATRPVAYGVGADLTAGVGIGKRVALGVDLPAYLWQTGTGSLPPTVVSGGKVPSTGLGDISLRAKVTLVSDDRMGSHAGFGLAALASVSLPTGDRASFAGDGDLTGAVSLLAGYTVGPASLLASAGYARRTEHPSWPDNGPVENGPPFPAGPEFGSSVPWSFGILLRPKAVAPSIDAGDRQRWEIALHGALPAGPVAPFVGAGASELSPALVALDDRVALGHYGDAYFVGGIDVGLDRAVGVPYVRGVIAFGWAPRPHDKDDDGVDDEKDQCPELPEDRDGIQDDDGCPEDDADDDGVLDAQDACPLVPG
ncbi:MAG: hypothetical protein ACRENE_25760, partial [Polyangiaceae bacterium]